MGKRTPRELLSHKLRDGAYRARKIGCHAVTIPVKDVLYLLDVAHCYYCKGILGHTYHLEHKIPLERGGSHTLDNIVKACTFCNLTKSTRTEEEFNNGEWPDDYWFD